MTNESVENLADCPICPMLATDRDDALRALRDRDEWCDHLAGRESALLLAVPRPFRMFVHRRAERIQREAQ